MSSLIFAQNLIFDLEGTIIDPRRGIENSIAYALHSMQIKPPKNISKFCKSNLSIQEILNKLMDQPNITDLNRASAHYRARYIKIGMFEHDLYEGIYETIKIFHEQGKSIFLMTNKPQEFCEIILEHLEIKKFIDAIYGQDLRLEKSSLKTTLVTNIMKKEALKPAYTMLIGDNVGDIEAAKENGIESVAAMWGFGEKAEITKKSPDYFCYSPKELIEIIQ